METSSLADRLTSRFIAGSSLDAALAVSKKLNAAGIRVSLDHLGESVTSLAEAECSRNAYLAAWERIAQLGLNATVSIKLTQLGLDLSERECWLNVERLVQQARALGSSVEVDMESSGYVDRTLALVSDLHARYGSVRAVIQAYLYRSERDIENLCRQSIPLRLCKGAYQESSDVAFAKKRDVDENYARLMIRLLDAGINPAIASHDENILQGAIMHARANQIDSDRFEFQMLYGIRRDLQRRLIAEGYRLRLYVPYGQAWYPYFMRRLAERPANVLFLARHLLRN
jgi:proline dehydrogenase